MLYTPIHFAVFLIICLLLPTLIYSVYLLRVLYLSLSEAYIDVSQTSSCYEKSSGETEIVCLVHVIAWEREGILR